MNTKAKLKYDNLSYYDEDLEKIAKLFCKENNYKYQKYSIDRILESVLVWYGKKGEENMFKIPFNTLKNYRIPLTNEKPIINWPSTWGHFIYYRKDIWELADLVTKWNGFTYLYCYRLYFDFVIRHSQRLGNFSIREDRRCVCFASDMVLVPSSAVWCLLAVLVIVMSSSL